MKYMMLLYGDEAAYASMSEAEQKEAFNAFMEYNRALAESGVLREGAELQPSMTARTLRMRDGSVVTTDGPFAEAREQMGGYYVLEVPSLDEALAWAAKCPAIYGGAIEVRALGTEPSELNDA